jgi:hypothetical protein
MPSAFKKFACLNVLKKYVIIAVEIKYRKVMTESSISPKLLPREGTPAAGSIPVKAG